LLVAMGPLALIIVAVGVAIKAVSAYFKGSVDGAEDFAAIMGVLKGIMAFVQDAFISLGRAIVTAFKNPREALDNFKEAFANATEGIVTRWEGLLMVIRGFIDKITANLGLLKEKIRGIFGKEREDEIAKWEAKATEAQDAILQGKFQLQTAARTEADLEDKTAKKEEQRAKNQKRREENQAKLLKQIEGAKDIAAAEVALKKLENAAIVKQAKLTEEIAQNRLTANDSTVDAITAHQAALDAEEGIYDLYQSKLDIAKAQEAIAQKNYDLAESNLDDEKELETAKANVLLIEAEREKKLKAIVVLQEKTLKDTKALTQEQKDFNKQLDATIKSQADNQQAALEANEELFGETAQKNLLTYNQLINRQAFNVAYASAGYVVLTENTEEWIKRYKDLTGIDVELAKVSDGVYKIVDSTDLLITGTDGVKRVVESTYEATEEQILAADEALTAHISKIDLFKASWQEAWASAGEGAETFATILADGMIPALEALGTAFGKMAAEGKISWKGLVGTIIQAVGKIVSAYLAVAIAGVLADSAKKGVPVGLILAAIGVAAFTALFATLIPAYAEGGYVDKPTLALIGESGPEYIVNQKQMRGLQGGGQKLYGEVTVEGQDLLLAIGNAEAFKNTY